MNIEIANRLVELRKQNNLSQEALAEKLGISRQAVSKWERADASPDMDNLITLSKLYQISLDELLGTGNGANSVSCPVAESRAEVMEADPVVIIEEEKVKFNFASLRHFPVYMVVAIAFIILGAVWNLWHPAWLLFLIAPIWQTTLLALEKRDARQFAYPVLVTFIYLCLGFFGSLWHPGWVVFLTIPMYYPIVNYVRKLYKEQKKELDGILGGAGKIR